MLYGLCISRHYRQKAPGNKRKRIADDCREGKHMNEVRIGEIIKELRGIKGISQETLAGVCDVSMQAVSKWENGQSCPDITFLPLLADYFQVSIDYLLTGRETENADAVQLTDRIKDMTEEDILYVIQYRNGKILDQKMWEQRGSDAEDWNTAVRIVFEDEFCRIKDGFRVEVWGNADIRSNNNHLDLHAGASITCGPVEGDVKAGVDVNCGAVEGDVRAGSDITCGAVEGDVTAGSSITCSDIEGNVQAGCSISCQKISGDAVAGMQIRYES